MRDGCTLAVLVGALLVGAISTARAQGPARYDAGPLLTSLRAEERAGVAAQAQLTDPNELTLYELAVDVADDLRSFTLEETVFVTNRDARPWSDVVFRVFANAVGPSGEAPLVSLSDGACLDGVACRVSSVAPSTIVVRPARALAPGESMRIRMRLRGRLREIDPSRTTMMGQGMESLGALGLGGQSGGAGHGGGDYGLLAHSDGVASFASFFAVLARRRGGMWEQSDASTMGDLGSDELAHVRAQIRVADGVRVVATGEEAAPRVVGRRTEHVVLAAFVRDFAFVASPRLRHTDRRVGGVDVRSWYVDGDEASGREVLEAAAQSMQTFSRRFGAYPWRQLDVVEAPLVGGAGGVEFTGMVTVSTMFYRPMNGGPGGDPNALLGQLLGGLGGGGGSGAPSVDLEARRHAMLELVTAHEVAHQWWHGIVGSDSREHPYQDECLAQWSALLYFAERHGAARAQEEARQQVASSYHMMRLMGHADGAVDRPVSAFDHPLAYAGLVYGKGPYLYVELRRLLGDARFFRALADYVRTYRFRMAPPRALLDAMARGPRGARVRALAHRWLEEEHGDDDLGQPDVGQMLGLPAGATDDPATRAILQMLGQMGQGGGPGSGGSGGGGDSDAQLREMMRGLLGGGGAGGGEGSQEMLRGLMEMMQSGTP